MTHPDRLRIALIAAMQRWVPAGTARAAAMRLGGGTAIAQMLMVVSAPVLTRLYTPFEMGQFGLLASFVTFATVGVSLRYDMSIVPAGTDEEADRLLAVAFAVTVPMSIAAALLMLLLVRRDLLSFGSLPASAVGVALPLMIATGWFGAARYWAIRRNDYGTVARASVVQGVGRALLPLVAGAVGASWWGLVLGEFGGRLLGIGSLIRRAIQPMRGLLSRAARASLVDSALVNWRYPIIVAPSSILDALGSALALPIVADTFGASAAGELLIVQRMAAVPATLVGASVADVFHAKVSALFRDDPARLRGMVWRTVWQLTLIACAIYIPLGIASVWGFALVFGSQWQQAGYLIALFTPLSIATLAIGPVTRLYSVVNRPELKLVFDLAMIAVPILAIGVLHSRGYGFWWCMGAYVALATLAFLIQLGMTVWAAGLPARARNGVDDQSVLP